MLTDKKTAVTGKVGNSNINNALIIAAWVWFKL